MFKKQVINVIAFLIIQTFLLSGVSQAVEGVMEKDCLSPALQIGAKNFQDNAFLSLGKERHVEIFVQELREHLEEMKSVLQQLDDLMDFPVRALPWSIENCVGEIDEIYKEMATAYNALLKKVDDGKNKNLVDTISEGAGFWVLAGPIFSLQVALQTDTRLDIKQLEEGRSTLKDEIGSLERSLSWLEQVIFSSMQLTMDLDPQDRRLLESLGENYGMLRKTKQGFPEVKAVLRYVFKKGGFRAMDEVKQKLESGLCFSGPFLEPVFMYGDYIMLSNQPGFINSELGQRDEGKYLLPEEDAVLTFLSTLTNTLKEIKQEIGSIKTQSTLHEKKNNTSQLIEISESLGRIVQGSQTPVTNSFSLIRIDRHLEAIVSAQSKLLEGNILQSVKQAEFIKQLSIETISGIWADDFLTAMNAEDSLDPLDELIAMMEKMVLDIKEAVMSGEFYRFWFKEKENAGLVANLIKEDAAIVFESLGPADEKTIELLENRLDTMRVVRRLDEEARLILGYLIDRGQVKQAIELNAMIEKGLVRAGPFKRVVSVYDGHILISDAPAILNRLRAEQSISFQNLLSEHTRQSIELYQQMGAVLAELEVLMGQENILPSSAQFIFEKGNTIQAKIRAIDFELLNYSSIEELRGRIDLSRKRMNAVYEARQRQLIKDGLGTRPLDKEKVLLGIALLQQRIKNIVADNKELAARLENESKINSPAEIRQAQSLFRLSQQDKLHEIKILGAQDIGDAILNDPKKFGFILENDPLLNEGTGALEGSVAHNPFAITEDTVDYRYLRSDKFDFDKFFDSLGIEENDFTIYRYLRALDKHLPGIIGATKKLLEDEKNKADHYIVLGRGGDLIYWTMKYFLNTEKDSQCHLIDFSRYGFDCLKFAQEHPDAFSRYIEELGIEKSESIIIIDEFTTSGYFLPGVENLFKSIGYEKVRQVDIAHDVVQKARDYWGFNIQEIDTLYDAMSWLGESYNAGRNFEVQVNDEKWQYVYADWGSSNITKIKKNGKYLGWLNRAMLYRYLIENQPEMRLAQENSGKVESDILLQKIDQKDIRQIKYDSFIETIESAI